MDPNFVLKRRTKLGKEHDFFSEDIGNLRPYQPYNCTLQCDEAPFPSPLLSQAIYYVKRPNERTKKIRKFIWYLFLRQHPKSVNSGLVLLSQNGFKFPMRVLRESVLNEQNFCLASSTQVLAFSKSSHSGEGTEINLDRKVLPHSALSIA